MVWLQVSLGILAGMARLLAVLAGWPWLIRWSRYLRRERDECYVYGYSTHGLSGNTCPECGFNLREQPGKRTYKPIALWIHLLIIPALIGGAAVVISVCFGLIRLLQ